MCMKCAIQINLPCLALPCLAYMYFLISMANLSTYRFQIHYLYLLQQQNSQPEAPHRPKDSFSLPVRKHHLTYICLCVLFIVIVLTFVLQARPLLKMMMTRSWYLLHRNVKHR